MSHNEIVQAALADPELTQQERDNIEFALRFRALPFAERKNYTIPDFKPSRFGMPGLADLLTDGGPGGYNAQSIPDRVDEITAITLRLFTQLEVHGPPRSREAERQKAIERGKKREKQLRDRVLRELA